MSIRLFSTALSAAVLSLLAFPISAHITLAQSEASTKQHYRAVFKVPHGCNGSPTTKVTVQLPEGVINARPMPKAGWTLSTQKGAYTHSYVLYGQTLTEGVQEVTWSGGSLPDEHYDEFVLSVYLSDQLTPSDTLYFPTVQQCENGEERWVDIPDAESGGHHHHGGSSPAPTLKLLPAKPAHQH